MSGLIIGPILGSGIIILPPMAQRLAGNWAFPAWLATVTISMLFAWIFGRLSLLFPGEAGISAAVETAFGPKLRRLTSIYLIGAVFFGPVAVMLTIVRYLPFNHGGTDILPGVFLTLLAAGLLLQRISFLGTVALIASSVTSCILFGGAVVTILSESWTWQQPAPFNGETFLYTLLLLFWSVVGWEIIGNYSGELRNPAKNLPRAVFSSAVVIALVSLAVAFAMQIAAGQDIEITHIQVTAIIAAIFGRLSPLVMALLTLSLCGCTFLLFVGGSARLIASLAERRELPALLAGRTGNGSPWAAVGLLTMVHLCLFAGVGLGIIGIEEIVAVANAFFLCNGLIGILSAIKLFRDPMYRLTAIFLTAILTIILLQSSWRLLAAIAGIALLFLNRKRNAA